MDSFPPRAVCIAGVLTIAAGAGAVAEMIVRLMEGHFHFHLGFVGIPIGYGILIGRDSSRRWVLFFARLGVVLCILLGGWFMFKMLTGGLGTPEGESFRTWADWLMAALWLYVVVTVIREEHRVWFAAEKRDTAAAKSIAWGVTLAVVALNCGQGAERAQLLEAHARVQPIRVRITPYDAVSGNGLNNLSSHRERPSSLGPGAGTRLSTQISSVMIHGAEGMSLECYGVVAEPFQVTVGSAGHESKVVTLDAQSPAEIRVPLQPLAEAKAKAQAAEGTVKEKEKEGLK